MSGLSRSAWVIAGTGVGVVLIFVGLNFWSSMRAPEVWPRVLVSAHELPFTSTGGYDWLSDRELILMRLRGNSFVVVVRDTQDETTEEFAPGAGSLWRWSRCSGSEKLLIETRKNGEFSSSYWDVRTGETVEARPSSGERSAVMIPGEESGVLEIVSDELRTEFIRRSPGGEVRVTSVSPQRLGSFVGMVHSTNLLFMEVLKAGWNELLPLVEVNPSSGTAALRKFAIKMPQRCAILDVTGNGNELLVLAAGPGRKARFVEKRGFPFLAIERTPAESVLWRIDLHTGRFKELIRTKYEEIWYPRWVPGGQKYSIQKEGRVEVYRSD